MADRRWLFVSHSSGLSYRAHLATAAPGAILAVRRERGRGRGGGGGREREQEREGERLKVRENECK